MAKDCIKPIALTSINATTFTGNFQAINAGLPESCVLLRIVNDTTKDLTISYDGATPHDYVRSGSTIELNLQTNARPNNYVAQLKKGTIVYVRATAGTGLAYLAGYYIPNS